MSITYMDDNPNHVKIFPRILLLILILLLVAGSFYTLKYYRPLDSKSSTSNSKKYTNISEIKDIPATTGGAVTSEPEEFTKVNNSVASFKSMLPINNNNYSVDFDYSHTRFIVVIKEPYDENLSIFNSWLAKTFPSLPTKFISIKRVE